MQFLQVHAHVNKNTEK